MLLFTFFGQNRFLFFFISFHFFYLFLWQLMIWPNLMVFLFLLLLLFLCHFLNYLPDLLFVSWCDGWCAPQMLSENNSNLRFWNWNWMNIFAEWKKKNRKREEQKSQILSWGDNNLSLYINHEIIKWQYYVRYRHFC